MIFKRTVPYVITSTALMLLGAHSMRSNDKTTSSLSEKAPTNKICLVTKTNNHIQHKYDIDSMVSTDAVAINASSQKHDVVYTRSDGNKLIRSGGTRAWRNNNPGCLRYSDFTKHQGAIGEAGGFAVFPDEETGMRAISALLKSDKYKKLTISQAISKYAPPHENDTEHYNASLREMTGLQINTKLSALNNDQIMKVVKAIRIVEGWRIGKETFIQTTPVDTMDLYANAQKQIIQRSLEKTL